MNKYLPITKEDLDERGWSQLDFLFISGDAYVDDPSFGPAVICRVLESHGYKVGIISQPDWKDLRSIKILGKPRLGVLISAGNLDSMLSHYTAARKRRKKDSYTAGGIIGKRPDHATIVYSRMVKKVWKDIPIVIGGIEASLRRFTHYDYWEDKLRPSILLESDADLLIYGMGEKQIVEIANYLSGGLSINDIRFVKGTMYHINNLDELYEEYISLPSHSAILNDKKEFAHAFKLQDMEQDAFNGKIVVQEYNGKYAVQNIPPMPLTTEEMDAIYDLPYCRNYHPSYEILGGVPAIDEVKFSIVGQRGCFGSCSFCAIHAHQGRIIQSRSHESIIKEAKIISKLPNFKGYIHDVGGPTANFTHVSCKKQLEHGVCKDRQCLFPEPCPNIDHDHSDYIKLLRELRQLPGIKKVFIRSGIRYDYLLLEESDEFLTELCKYHVSGQLKIAPEHVATNALKYMRKPGKEVYLKFMKAFKAKNEELGLKQYLIPYFISSHPGCKMGDAVQLSEFLRDINHQPEQVQDFIPTPSSYSTAMYYSGVDPETGKEVFVTRNPHHKAMQRALMQFKNPRNKTLVKEALVLAQREDLIGNEPRCLISNQTGINRRNDRNNHYFKNKKSQIKK
jgi:uncharacterized radical SAM protein YgiQ